MPTQSLSSLVMSSREADKKARAHAHRLLMTHRKTVVVGRFQEPSESMSAVWLEHEISRYFTH